MTVSTTAGHSARRALTIDAVTSCGQVDELFLTRPTLSSAVVADGGRLGLVMRDSFSALMSGPFGYGRMLWATRPVGDVADWSPVRVPAAATLVATAERLRARPFERRYDDVLVDLDGGSIGWLSAAALFDGLAELLAHRAIHDELTGLVNRTHFLDLLTAACATREAQLVVVAVVDLDGMKRINDSFGYTAGDTVLTQVARRLADTAAPGDVVARLGADEFAVLRRIPAWRPAQAAAELGHRLRLAITASAGHAHPRVAVRASVGIAVSGRLADPATLMSEADMAMFQSKLAGGDGVEVTINVGADLGGDVHGVDRSVADAIRDRELRLWYQPVIRLRDHSVAHIEALVRWQHPRMGLLGPARFLPGARRRGHLPALDRWVFGQACGDLLDLDARLGARAPAQVAVNLSPATLATDFDQIVDAVLTDTGLPAHRLVVEVPEDADLDTLAVAAPRFERLRTAGINLVLDDMGAGSTSLRHLSTLAIGGLKIDAAFVAGMVHNPRDHTVVKLLADLGHGLQLPVTAEGVETADQLAAVAALGIEYAQGYHLGRPQPLDKLTASLDRRVRTGSGR